MAKPRKRGRIRMITLFTTLFVGLYWLFTNIILLPSMSTQNASNILILGIIELLIEVALIIFITAFVKTAKEKFNKDKTK